MRTLRLEKNEDISLVQNKIPTYINPKNEPITSRADTEKIIADLKAKMEAEEKQKEINTFIIQLLLFITIGLFFIYFYIENL